MLRIRDVVLLVGVAMALSQTPQLAEGQGKGGGKGQGGGQGEGKGQGKGKGKGSAKEKEQAKEQNKEQGKGKSRVNDNRASRDDDDGSRRGIAIPKEKGQGKGKFVRVASLNSMPQSVRRFATSRRAQDVILAAAVSHAFARGRGDDIRIVEVDDGLRLATLNGEPLVFLDDDRARNLGRWRVGVLDDEVRDGGPSFCRSGEGHPVWGRQWCLDKGFGLGSFEDFRWGRTTDLDDFSFSRTALGVSLVGAALERALGTTAFNRLALHAVTLGLVEPLAGRWVADPGGPHLFLVNSGGYPVAEVVDVNRDYRADNMIVALRSW